MAMEVFLTDGLAHGGAGVILALLDFITSRIANPKATRIANKQRCLQAIERLLDAENPPKPQEGQEDAAQTAAVVALAKDSTEYAEQVKAVRDYLQASGIVKLDVPLPDRIKAGVKHLIAHEKLNGLSYLQKLGVAAGIEVLFDVVTFSASPAIAIASDLYQIPAFFVGLWVGNGIKKVIDVIIASADEKKLDKTIRQLLKETPIIDVIVKYMPPEQVQTEFAERGLEIYRSQLTRAGQTVLKNLKQLAETAKTTADEMLSYAHKSEEQQKQEQEERKKRFDELTKGH